MDINKQTAYEGLRLSIVFFLKQHKYIREQKVNDSALLKEELNLSGTDLHIICNYVSRKYHVEIDPVEIRHCKTFAELISFFNYKIQRLE